MKLSSKILAAAFVIAIVLVAVPSVNAAGYVFTRNLTVGSTGADVSALQSAVGVVPATGYFGSITKAAVVKFQISKGISGTGYVGPLTMAALNAAPAVTPSVALCPNGMTLASNCSVAPGTTGTPVVAGNGTDGTLNSAQSSFVSSGISIKKGETKDVVAINLKASAGPVTVVRAGVHFNTRPWLVLSQVTLHDSNGKVLATKALSSAADATEITVGSDYLVQFDNLNYVVNPGANVDLVVGATVLSATDKIPTLGLSLKAGFDGTIRTINGVQWTDTVSDAGFDGATGVGLNTVTLTSTGSVADVYARISPNSPSTRQVAVSTTQTTSNVVLGTFSLKSANNPSTLNTLVINLNGVAASTANVSNVRLFNGATSYGGTVASNGSTTFSNLTIPLAQDVWQDFTIEADVAANVSGVATVSLTANAADIVVTDANYNTATIEGSTATSNNVTFTTNAVTVTSASATVGSAIVQANSTVGYNVTYGFVLTNTSNNDLYVSATSSVLVGTSTTVTTGSSTLSAIQTVSPSSYNGDTTGLNASYVIPAGLSRSFTLIGAIRGTTGQTVNLKVTQVNYGTTTTATTAANINFGLESLSATASF